MDDNSRPTKMAKSSSDTSDEFELHSQHLEDERLKTATLALEAAKKEATQCKDELTELTKLQSNATGQGAKEMGDLANILVQKMKGANELVVLRSEQVKAIEEVVSISDLDCDGCRLSSAFLKKNDLQSYVDGAIACQDKVDVNKVLESLDFDASISSDGHISPFVAIVASSGTGKTQLAATSAHAGHHVCYFYTGARPSDMQKFYEPHRKVSEKLGKYLATFSAGISTFVRPSLKGTVSNPPAASQIHEFFGTGEEADRTVAIPLLSLLSKCLLGDDGSLVSFEVLRDRITSVKKRKKFMVFLDEVPPAGTQNFDSAMLLRNVLRVLGLCPIMMSTHSGALNCIPRGSDSRVEGKWCRLIVKLPKFHAPKETYEQNPWLRSSERPLVAAVMAKHEEKSNLANIVEHVKKFLEERKAGVWDNSVLQLCQLMRSKAETDETGICLQEYNHRVCGAHFGRVTLENGATFVDLGRRASLDFFEKHAAVAFVDPEIEPVLFLAITAWKREHLDGTGGLFPLISESERNPISVRKVFKIHERFFEPQIRLANLKAKKLCGNRLEVLALTSITLASLQYTKEVWDTTCLSDFLAYTHHFMCSQEEQLVAQSIEKCATDIGVMLEGTSFGSISVPTCCCVESDFAQIWDKGVWGKLESPPDSGQRDGELSLEMQSNEKHLLHIECKNHKDGLGTRKFKEVIARMQPNKANLMLLFTTTLNGLFHKPTWAGVYGDDAGDYCVMVLEGSVPRWLKVGQEEDTELSPGEKCKALIVVLLAGPV